MTRVAAVGRALCTALTLAAAGCASSDLSQKAGIMKQVRECLPTDSPPPSFVGRAFWYSGATGFGSTGMSPLGGAAGLLVLDGGTLYFMGWSDELSHYDVEERIDIGTVTHVRVDRAGPSSMLVVESRNHTFDGFELMRAGELGTDTPGTEALCAKVQGMLVPLPAPP